MSMDIRTLAIAMGITHFVQVIVFSFQTATNTAYRGFGWWLLWSALAMGGFAFIPLRDIPAIHSIAIVGQNSLITLAVIFLYIGILRFLDKRENRWLVSAIFLFVLFAISYYTYVHDDIVRRTIVICLAWASISLLTAYGLIAHRIAAVKSSVIFLAAIFILHGCFFIFRAALVLSGANVQDAFNPSLFNASPYLDGIVVSLLWTCGLIIMVNQRSNAEMSEARKHFELVFNTSPDASMITRLTDGLIVNVNDGFTSLTGFSRGEAIGKSSLEVDIWKDPADRRKVAAELKEKGSCANRESLYRKKDGSLVLGALSAKVLILGGIPHIISVTRDITEQKRAEGEIRRLNDELELRVLERTRQLEETSRELEDFTYAVSHNLRAPLRAVDGYANMLLEDFGSRMDSEGRRICAVISDSGRMMGKLIDGLLSFSRIGRARMQVSRVDMLALAQSVFLELTDPGNPERIEFRVKTLPPVYGDPSLLRQVWVNLIGNAVKFVSKKKGALIEVDAKPFANEVVYSIRDNGAGFDMAYADKLFRVFQSLHSPGEFDGLGAGLAIVQRIIHRHGGRIWAEGETGKGAVFYFTVSREGA